MSLLLALSLTFVLFTRAENTKNTAAIGQILALAIERTLYPVLHTHNIFRFSWLKRHALVEAHD